MLTAGFAKSYGLDGWDVCKLGCVRDAEARVFLVVSEMLSKDVPGGCWTVVTSDAEQVATMLSVMDFL